METEHVLKVDANKSLVSVLCTSGSTHLIDSDGSVKLLGEVKGNQGALAWRGDGELMAVVDELGACKVWKLSPTPALTHDLELRHELKDVSFGTTPSDRMGVLTSKGQLLLFDEREMSTPRVAIMDLGGASSLRFSPFLPHLLLSAGTDPLIALWDLRKTSDNLHEFAVHDSAVSTIEWSPTHQWIFVSADADGMALLWDCDKIGEEVDGEEEAPSELLFKHMGHSEAIRALCWGQSAANMLLTADASNMTHFWQIDNSIWAQ